MRLLQSSFEYAQIVISISDQLFSFTVLLVKVLFEEKYKKIPFLLLLNALLVRALFEEKSKKIPK